MAATPNLEDFNPKQFARELKAFLTTHNLSSRDLAKKTKTSLATLHRLEHNANLTVASVVNLQKFMRTYRGAA